MTTNTLEPVHPKPREVESIQNALSSEQHAEIAENLSHIYDVDVAENIANRIRQARPPWKNDGSGEWEHTPADWCATELLNAVCKLQVVIAFLIVGIIAQLEQ